NNFTVTLSACWVKNTPYAYDYTGGEQTFTAPCNGYYKLEVWGAQGGDTKYYVGGKGGYSIGSKYLAKTTRLFVYAGGMGGSSEIGKVGAFANGGYNGGGNGIYNYNYITGNYANAQAAGGGGATHIATTTGLLKNLLSDKNAVLIVAGGGGGGHLHDAVLNHGTGGGGGGVSGSYAADLGEHNISYSNRSPNPGSQTSAGCAGTVQDGGDTDELGCGGFGYGGDATTVQYSGSGGGGGWYGGSSASCAPGAGGSGYIGGVLNGSMMNDQRSGNGYAKITYLGPTV
ncbi:hypothetical protein IJ798_02240, partial [Candidatus Saccharibacteria bacterium]|nr:hypothetical protein [Candidatus Saccharibacteria bacterium]